MIPRSTRDDSGFTLVEMVAAIALTAFAFAGIAMMMLGTLRAISVQKARSQGNEVATQAIEDLQRLPYDKLVLCNQAPAPVPAAFSDPVLAVPSCSSLPDNQRFKPCNPNPAATALDESYICPRNNVDYIVRRFVGYGDPAHTEKQLAVFVSWNDSAGPHEVSQQSSLRIPTKSIDIGDPPPVLNRASTQTPAVVDLEDSGVDANKNSSVIDLQTTATGLTSPDTVIAVFTVLNDAGNLEQASWPLATANNGATWSGSVPARQFRFPKGKQWFVFSGARASDGKVTSVIREVPTTFETTTGAPIIQSASVSAASLQVTPTGDLAAANPSFTVTVTTQLIGPNEDIVTLLLPTRTGIVNLAMQAAASPVPCPNPATTCDTTWTATVEDTDGFRFAIGDQPLYLAVAQKGAGGTYWFNVAGGTNAQATSDINFHL